MATLVDVRTAVPTTMGPHVDLCMENSAQFPATALMADNINTNSNVLPSLAKASYLHTSVIDTSYLPQFFASPRHPLWHVWQMQ